MDFPRTPIGAWHCALLLAATLQAGCSVPLGPGFSHTSRRIEVAPVSGEAARLQLEVADRLSNTGNSTLRDLAVNLSAGSVLKPENLTVRVDGREIQASPQTTPFGAPGSGAPAFGTPEQIRLSRPWPPKEVRTLVTNYEIAPGSCDCGVSAATKDGFYVADPAAFPVFQPPGGLLAESNLDVRAGTLKVAVPSDFKVLAGGRARRTDRRGSLVGYEFRLRARDFPAYLIAGRYQERRIKAQRGEVIFWTFQPLNGSAGQPLAMRLSGTAATFDRLFGRLSKNSPTLWIVEAPFSSAQIAQGISASSFPDGVLLEGRSFTQGPPSEDAMEEAEYNLARTWFGWRARPDRESDILLGRGISLFAVALAAEARGGEAARRRVIARLLASYDAARGHAQSDAIIDLPSDASREQRGSSAFRSALFFAALEDQAGPDAFGRAMRRLLAAMKGQEISYKELRSALETATGSDFAEVFRVWLDRARIPGNFRARYGTPQ